ncbi:unnamed protein product [Pieris brassicae]|uniref:Uncharacterized protein n=1 Tax=Pieris brassicae TaxID=7116 RepID=A0A9P0X6V6_PIEBR|nr:unnamed protein product [Pieris brassicae]
MVALYNRPFVPQEGVQKGCLYFWCRRIHPWVCSFRLSRVFWGGGTKYRSTAEAELEIMIIDHLQCPG